MQQVRLSVTSTTGLHARPAAQLVQTASQFQSTVTIEAAGKSVNAKSILQVLSLGAANGTEITVSADGPDEAECLSALASLLMKGFA